MVDTSVPSGIYGSRTPAIREREFPLANHLTPTELADELNMKRREVISKCMEMGVPIFNGRIDKTLFLSSLRSIQSHQGQPSAA
jgi:hypothetical protein